MIEWAITSSVLILVVLVLRRLLRGKISLRLQYGLWALVLLRLLLPISFGATAVSVLNLVDQAPIQTDSPAPGHGGDEELVLSLAEPGLGSAVSGGQAQNQAPGQAEGAAGLSRRDEELCCDEATVRRLGEKERAAYGRTLLAVTCRGYGSSLLAATHMTGGKKGVQERIWFLTKRPGTAFCSWVGVILVMTLTAGCTFTNSRSSAPQEEGIQGGKEENLVWVNGIRVSGLAPEEEITGSGEITIATGESEYPYSLTCSRREVTVELGLRGKDGTEYTQTVTGGSASGSFRDLPAGTYQLFVRNGGTLSELPNDPENPEDYLLDGVVNLYQADKTSFGTSSGTGFALGYPGASMELNPISWTFSRADIPLLEDALQGSGYLALYVDQDLTLRVTSDHVIEISRDGGLTWKAETCKTIDGEDFSVWLLENEPMPNFSLEDLRDRLKNGAEVRRMVLAQGKEIYFVLDKEGAFLELVQEEKIQALLLDGQRLVCTSTGYRPYRFSKSMFESFQGLLQTCNLIHSETEQEWSGVMAHLEEYGAQFS